MRWKDVDPYKEMQEWHKWFAWYPVTIGEERVWLETVERRARFGMSEFGDIEYSYRNIQNETPEE